jgi:hypothetical protein
MYTFSLLWYIFQIPAIIFSNISKQKDRSKEKEKGKEKGVGKEKEKCLFKLAPMSRTYEKKELGFQKMIPILNRSHLF